jgi:hypothetical protein
VSSLRSVRPGGSSRLAGLAALLSGVGALAYSTCWLLAGRKAPGMGGTSQARVALEWLAVPGSGAAIVGLLLTILLALRALFTPAQAS